MALPGLTPQGFVATTVDEEVADLNAKFLANVNGSLDLDPDQPIGQIIGTFAAKFAAAMELGATVYNAINPNAAEGNLLANACALSGTYPQVATYSYVYGVQLTLAAGASVAAGSVAQVSGQPNNTWTLVGLYTPASGSTAAFTTPGPVTNTGTGTAVLLATFQSSQPGPFVANANTLTVIGTPTVGWTAVNNPSSAIAGVAADTDTTLRQRRALQVSGEGSGDLDSMRAAILKIAGVVQCFVYENTTRVADSTGLPGNSFRVVVWDGIGMNASNTAIAQAIWNNKPPGIPSYGATQANAIDSAGNTRVMSFDRAQQVVLYLACTTTPPSLTTAQTNAVKAAFAAFATANYNLGTEVFALALRAAGIVPGTTTDVPTFQIDTVQPPVNTGNILMSTLQIPTLSTANMKVNGV